MPIKTDNKNIKCPFCYSKKIKKQGKRKSKIQSVQKYFCKKCNKYFSDNAKRISHKTYSTNIILNSILLYNVGYSQQKTSKLIAQKYKIKVPQRTISNWLNEHKNICTYHKLRKQTIKLYSPDEIIEIHTFMHNNLPYIYKIHKAKLELLFKSKLYNNQLTNISKFYQPLKSYLNKIPTSQFPHHIFQPKYDIGKHKEQRSSQLKFETLKFIKIQKQNLANILTGLALNLAKNNKQRHQSVQDFMLINDSTTTATEVPVYLTNDDIKYFKSKGFTLDFEDYETPITGHIDLIQIRNGLIHILDYKPEANKTNPINQLTLYALALASRTKLAVKDFKCAWFDDKNYYEFFPLHAVYPKQEKKIEKFK